MGGTYKKKLRAEKAKVKLKRAKLPKGLNITKTEFKVRKITIRDQCRATRYVQGQSLLNLKEVLSRLKHHNENFRLDAIRNLRNAITIKHPDLANKLGNIIQGVSALFLDVNRNVRRESCKTLSTLFVHKERELAISPFFHIISSYIRCAMTHIQPTIQEDSLKLLDVLLQHVPHLVATETNKIFENFLEMISKDFSEGYRAGRLLTVNMANHQTTKKWRSKVLHRLQKMFASLVQHKRQQQYDQENRLLKQRQQIFVTFNIKRPQYYGIVARRPLLSKDESITSSLFNNALKRDNSAAYSGTDISISANHIGHEIRNYIEHLMPLLHEVWLEVRPQIHHVTITASREEIIETILSSDAKDSLSIILDIMEKLWSLIDIEEKADKNHDLSLWFQNHSCNMFMSNFISTFYPYQSQLQQKQGMEETKCFKEKDNQKKTAYKEGNEITLDTTACMPENVLLAYLLCRFKGERITEGSEVQMHSIINYLTSIILKDMPLECWRPLLMVLKELLLVHSRLLLKYDFVAIRNLMKNTLKLYLQHKFHPQYDSQISTQLLLLLCDIIQDQELTKIYNMNVKFNEFLNCLPPLLLKDSIQERTLLALNQLAKQQNPQFIKALHLHMENIMKNLPKIQILGCVNIFEGKKLIINLFYWCKPKNQLPLDRLKRILGIIEKTVNDKRINSYSHYVFNLE